VAVLELCWFEATVMVLGLCCPEGTVLGLCHSERNVLFQGNCHGIGTAILRGLSQCWECWGLSQCWDCVVLEVCGTVGIVYN